MRFTVTNYLVDTSGSLSHVVAETDGTGALVAHYVRGNDLLAVMRPNGSGGWASRFYHSDHIGSVRRLTDESGTTTDGYTYDAFGTLLAHTGTDPQPYAFTGEPYDPNVGFQYHRARWMDPRVGRFLGIDPLEGRSSDPLSFHKYLYAAGGPINNSDPTGLFTFGEQTQALRVAYTIRATSVVSYRASVEAVKLKLVLAGAIAIGVGIEMLTMARIREKLDEDERTKGPRIYRNMRAAGVMPEVGTTSGAQLGARPGRDITPDANGLVWPNTGGMSVNIKSALAGEAFRIPRSLGGTSGQPTWALPIVLLPPGLVVTPSETGGNALHALVEPAISMSFTAYQWLLASTAPFWQKVAE